jgi:hypothetical protein
MMMMMMMMMVEVNRNTIHSPLSRCGACIIRAVLEGYRGGFLIPFRCSSSVNATSSPRSPHPIVATPLARSGTPRGECSRCQPGSTCERKADLLFPVRNGNG